MNNKGVGTIFCLISAIMYGLRYVIAGMMLTNSPTQGDTIFQDHLAYVGSWPLIISIVALVVGVFFLLLGLFKDGKKD